MVIVYEVDGLLSIPGTAQICFCVQNVCALQNSRSAGEDFLKRPGREADYSHPPTQQATVALYGRVHLRSDVLVTGCLVQRSNNYI